MAQPRPVMLTTPYARVDLVGRQRFLSALHATGPLYPRVASLLLSAERPPVRDAESAVDERRDYSQLIS